MEKDSDSRKKRKGSKASRSSCGTQTDDTCSSTCSKSVQTSPCPMSAFTRSSLYNINTPPPPAEETDQVTPPPAASFGDNSLITSRRVRFRFRDRAFQPWGHVAKQIIRPMIKFNLRDPVISRETASSSRDDASPIPATRQGGRGRPSGWPRCGARNIAINTDDTSVVTSNFKDSTHAVSSMDESRIVTCPALSAKEQASGSGIPTTFTGHKRREIFSSCDNTSLAGPSKTESPTTSPRIVESIDESPASPSSSPDPGTASNRNNEGNTDD